MSDLHSLVGALKEFREHQLEANRANREEHRDLMRAIAEIEQWRWKIEGMRIVIAATLGAFGGVAIQFISHR